MSRAAKENRLKVRRGSDVIRSRRPGATSLSESEQDRAAWYKSLQDEVFAKVRAERVELEDKGEIAKPAEPEPDLEPDEEVMDEPKESDEERLAREAKEKEEAEAEQARKIQELLDKNRREAKKFSGGAAFALAEESDAKRKEDEERRSNVGKVRRPDPETYVRPRDFDADLWVVRVGKTLPSAQARVLALPWLCGDAAVFKDLASVLNEENVELYSVQLPGRYVRLKEACFKSVFQIVHHIYEALQEKWMLDGDLPKLVVVGHAVGAIVAFELTLLIEKNLYESSAAGGGGGGGGGGGSGGDADYFGVKHLLVTSCNPPHIVTKLNSDRFETKFFCASGGELFTRFQQLNLPPVYLRERKDILQMYMPIFRADYTLLEKYIYWQDPPEEDKKDKNKQASRLANVASKSNHVLPCLRCPVTSMSARDDPFVDVTVGHEWGRHSVDKRVSESLIDQRAAKKEAKKERQRLKEEKRKKREERDRREKANEDVGSVASSTTGMGTEATLSSDDGSEDDSDNSSLDSRDSETRARDRERERRRIEAQGRPSTQYWKNIELGGHMFIRDAINKAYHDDFITTLIDICYE